MEDFYHLDLASCSEMIIPWEASICVPIKLGLGRFIPEDKRGLDRFVSLKKRGAWLHNCPSIELRGQDLKNAIRDT